MFQIFLVLAVIGVAAFPPVHTQQQSKLRQTFSLKEVFGVSHPKQIIGFDLQQNIDVKSTYLIGPEGTEVPYQLLRDGKIAVQTDLPANAERTWRLYSGKAPVPVKSAVQVTKRERYHEIT